MSNIEPTKEYDSNGNLIHYRDSNGYEVWYERDTNGNQIHYRNSIGYEEWYEYDANGNCIHYRNNAGTERFFDSEGNEYDNEDDCIRKNATIEIIDDMQEMSIEELNRLKEWINKEFRQ